MRLGLTGGIGSGKSTVARMLAASGATLIDTDAIAHELTGPGGAAMPDILTTFGPDYVNAEGALDRERMRELAFSEPEAKRRLEGLLHPLIGAVARARAAAAQSPLVVFDIPLLVESGHWRSRVDKVLVVDCTEATQITRVSARPGWSEARARSVIAVQAPRAARRAAADAVLFNEGLTLDELAAEVAPCVARWSAQA